MASSSSSSKRVEGVASSGSQEVALSSSEVNANASAAEAVNKLPDEVLCTIFKFASGTNCLKWGRIARVCQLWQNISEDWAGEWECIGHHEKAATINDFGGEVSDESDEVDSENDEEEDEVQGEQGNEFARHDAQEEFLRHGPGPFFGEWTCCGTKTCAGRRGCVNHTRLEDCLSADAANKRRLRRFYVCHPWRAYVVVGEDGNNYWSCCGQEQSSHRKVENGCEDGKNQDQIGMLETTKRDNLEALSKPRPESEEGVDDLDFDSDGGLRELWDHSISGDAKRHCQCGYVDGLEFYCVC